MFGLFIAETSVFLETDARLHSRACVLPVLLINHRWILRRYTARLATFKPGTDSIIILRSFLVVWDVHLDISTQLVTNAISDNFFYQSGAFRLSFLHVRNRIGNIELRVVPFIKFIWLFGHSADKAIFFVLLASLSLFFIPFICFVYRTLNSQTSKFLCFYPLPPLYFRVKSFHVLTNRPTTLSVST